MGTGKELFTGDIGFGDAVTPQPQGAELPRIFAFPAPHLGACRRDNAPGPVSPVRPKDRTGKGPPG